MLSASLDYCVNPTVLVAIIGACFLEVTNVTNTFLQGRTIFRENRKQTVHTKYKIGPDLSAITVIDMGGQGIITYDCQSFKKILIVNLLRE